VISKKEKSSLIKRKRPPLQRRPIPVKQITNVKITKRKDNPK